MQEAPFAALAFAFFAPANRRGARVGRFALWTATAALLTVVMGGSAYAERPRVAPSISAPAVGNTALTASHRQAPAAPTPPAARPEAPRGAALRELIDPAAPYMASVRRWAREFELPQSLLLAIIHTESRFNPSARSHRDAVGLMQLVAGGAGADAWRFITGEKRVPTEAELMDPDTNIRLGAAYLRLLKDHYWSDVADPAMRRTLVLLSYNWGVGNVRRRFQKGGELAAASLVAAIERAAPRESSRYLSAVQQRTQAYEALLVSGAERRLAAQ